jgi:hypothetical protein
MAGRIPGLAYTACGQVLVKEPPEGTAHTSKAVWPHRGAFGARIAKDGKPLQSLSPKSHPGGRRFESG